MPDPKSKLRLLCVALLIALIAVAALGCSPSETDDDWVVRDGRFHTKNLARAQQEIPFEIVLPSYVPGTAPPEISGPLRQKGSGYRVDVKIDYVLEPGKDKPARLYIFESNFPLSGQDQVSNAGTKNVVIEGVSVVAREGSQPEPWINFYFQHRDIYHVLGLYNLPYHEAEKVAASMLK